MSRKYQHRHSHVNRVLPYLHRNDMRQMINQREMMTTINAGEGDLARLHILCAQNKMKIFFELVEAKGPPHNPTFTMRLSISNAVGTVISQTVGTATSKKSAKQQAAAQYLRNMVSWSRNYMAGAITAPTRPNNQLPQISDRKAICASESVSIEKKTVAPSVAPAQAQSAVVEKEIRTSKIIPKKAAATPSPQNTLSRDPVSILDHLCRSNSRLGVPMYEFKTIVNGDEMKFQCDCKVKGTVAIGIALKKKEAKKNAAKLVLELLNVNKQQTSEQTPAKCSKDDNKKTVDPPEDVYVISDSGGGSASEDDSIPVTNGTDNIDEIDYDNDAPDTDANFKIMENVDDAQAFQKLANIVKRYIEIYADELKCTPGEYLAAVNHWRHPSVMTNLLHMWITSTLQCKLRDSYKSEVKLMHASVVRANNLLLTETSAHVFPSNYEYCAWTPIRLVADDGENADYIVITSTDACGNGTTLKHQPKIGETIVCHHTAKFRFRGSQQSKNSHIYLITEWKRDACDDSDASVQTVPRPQPVWSLENFRQILLCGLQGIHNQHFDYNLSECIEQWQRLIKCKNSRNEIASIFLDHYVDIDQIRSLLHTFMLVVQANKRHNARNCNCDDGIYRELFEKLLKPIDENIATS